MLDFQCWFCGSAIDRSDAGATKITVENLWRWATGNAGRDAPRQSLYAHTECAREKLRGATMDIEPELLSDGD